MRNNLRIVLTVLALLAVCSKALAAGDGVRLPGVILRPSLEASLTHDDNIHNMPDRTESDWFYSGMLRLSLAPRSAKLRASADAWGRAQRYVDNTRADTDEVGQRLQLLYGSRDTARLSLYQRFVAVDRYDRGPVGRDLSEVEDLDPALIDPNLQERVSMSKRRLLDIGLNADRDLTDKTALEARLAFSDVSYRGRQGRSLNDTSAYRGILDFGWRATDKTTVFLSADGSLHDTDTFEDTATAMALRLGASSRTTEKLRFRAGLGFGRYDYVTRQEGTEGRKLDRSHDRTSFELGAAWHPTDRLVFQARGFSRFQPAVQYAGIATHHNTGQLSATYRIVRDVYLSANGGLRREDYLDPVMVTANGGLREVDKYIEISTLSARVAYRPANAPMMLHLDVRENRSRSNDPQSIYDATQISAGVSLWY